MSNRGKGKKFRGRKRQRGDARHDKELGPSFPRLRIKEDVVDPAVMVKLKYYESDWLKDSGSQVYAYAWHTNNAYDVYPGTGGAAMPGFSTYAQFYDYYRVRSYWYNIEVTNLEAFPVDIYFINNTVDWSSAPSNLNAAAMNSLCQSAQLPPVGTHGAHRTFKFRASINEITGAVSPTVADNFQGKTDGSTNPADHTYLTIGVNSNSILSPLTKGVAYKIVLGMVVHFYGRTIQT